ncbi:MAG: HIT domain-containing protein [Thermodesulfobacteriota bacterium]
MDCIFCKIADGAAASEVVHENKDFIVVKDLHPQAPTHLLVMPRAHYPSLLECSDEPALSGLLTTAVEAAKKYGFAASGFRSIINTGSGGGQTVFHLHMHIMSGKKLTEKMV